MVKKWRDNVINPKSTIRHQRRREIRVLRSLLQEKRLVPSSFLGHKESKMCILWRSKARKYSRIKP
jgi:hypothetical protein